MNSKKPIRIANCSGFYGDKLSAARELMEGGPIDVLTGDYLAELTMSILYQQQQKNPETGYVGTFLKQVREVLSACVANNIKIVTNAGGLNPRAMADRVGMIADELGLEAKIAYIEGDNVLDKIPALQNSGERFTHLEKTIDLSDSPHNVVSANVYFGAWGICEALAQGADIVICPRVTDAALVIGPAAWHFNWQRDDFDALAGALTAGHIIECGAQASGGNYAFFQEVPSFDNVGYPIAEIEADGSFTISKHPGTGGLVSVGTVTAQLLYEISTPAYINPDVVAHFDAMTLEQVGPDKVRISGCKGSSPPGTAKVCMNLAAGYRNGMNLIITGLDIEEKAELFTNTLFRALGGREQFDAVDVQLIRQDKDNPNTNEEASAKLKINVKSKNAQLVGRYFSAKVIELALANYPGFSAYTTPGDAQPYIVYWPALISARHVREQVVCGGKTTEIMPTANLGLPAVDYVQPPTEVASFESAGEDSTTIIPLGRLYGTRSGDKGGCANLGVWAKTKASFHFLYHYLSVEKLKELLPDLRQFPIQRYELPNLLALNFYIEGILGDGVSSSTRDDPQAKGLGEYLRVKKITVPQSLLAELDALQENRVGDNKQK